jgi:hypothetical protein
LALNRWPRFQKERQNNISTIKESIQNEYTEKCKIIRPARDQEILNLGHSHMKMHIPGQGVGHGDLLKVSEECGDCVFQVNRSQSSVSLMMH